MSELARLYEHEAVRKFGEAIGKAIGEEDDYASLTELESAQNEIDFSDAIHRFMRRFLTFARSHPDWYCPSEGDLVKLMQIVDDCASKMPFQDERRKKQEAIRLVRAALLSRALAQACYLKRKEQESKSGGEQ